MKKEKTLSRILALLLVLVMAASLTACAVKDKGSDSKKEDSNQSSQDNNSEDTDSDDKNSEDTNTPADTKTDSGVLAAKTDVTAEDILAKDFSENIKISFAVCGQIPSM